MSTNQTQSTQRTTPDPLKSTREKLARKIKTSLKTTSPEETLQIWMLIKQQELQIDCSESYWSRNIELRPWKLEEVKFLTHQWNQATQLLNQAYELIEWIEADPNTNFSHLLALWNLTLDLK